MYLKKCYKYITSDCPRLSTQHTYHNEVLLRRWREETRKQKSRVFLTLLPCSFTAEPHVRKGNAWHHTLKLLLLTCSPDLSYFSPCLALEKLLLPSCLFSFQDLLLLPPLETAKGTCWTKVTLCKPSPAAFRPAAESKCRVLDKYSPDKWIPLELSHLMLWDVPDS